MIPYFQVKHTKSDGTIKDFNLTPYVLTFQASLGAEASKNTCTLELQNHDGALNTQYFEIDKSQVTIYLDWETINPSRPIMSAIVSAVESSQGNEGKYKIKITLTDKTGLFLSKVWAYAITEDLNWDAPTIIKNVVGHLNDLTSRNTTYVNDQITTNNVATVRSDGSAFPKPITISKIWKPGYEWLNDLSQPQYTYESLPYVYYVDANNDLHWTYSYQKPIVYLTSSIDSSVTTIPVTSTTNYPTEGNLIIEKEAITYTGLTSTSFTGCTRGAFLSSPSSHASGIPVTGDTLYLGRQDIYSMNIGTSQEATYNMIIYNGGKTPAGYDLLWYKIDLAQRGRQFRMRFFDWKNVASDMTNKEMNRTEWGTDKSSRYPKPGGNALSPSNTYTPLFQKYNTNTRSWESVACTSNEEYHDTFEQALQDRCDNKCDSYFRTGKQRFTATVQVRGTTQYLVNQMVSVTSPKFSTEAVPMTKFLRLKDIKHQLNKGSWITDLSLEEDPTAIDLYDTTS